MIIAIAVRAVRGSREHRTDAVGAELEDLASEPVETFQEQDSMMSAPGFVLAWTAESLP